MSVDQCIIFYSWASDHPSGTTRTFIEKALQGAVKDLHRDETIEIEPVIDRDTQGVPGSPDIASTIFSKIDRAQIFVCDVSIVDQNAQRPSPNPNVLIELGYALKALGHERIIMVMNTAFGVQELLPFDLRFRRVTLYAKEPDANDQGQERKMLQSILTEAVRTILPDIEQRRLLERPKPPTIAEIAHEAITASHPDTDERVRQYMEWVGEQIAALTPKRTTNDSTQQPQWEEDLLSAISTSVPMVIEFSQVAQTAVSNKATESLIEIYEGFSHILDLYHTAPGFRGTVMPSDFDLPRFIGHELFVTFCGLMIRSKQWESLAELLNRGIYVENGEYHEPETMSYDALSEYVRLLGARKDRLKLNRRLIHADILNERHADGGPLAQVLPMKLFTEADYFLYLRGQLIPDTAPAGIAWRPWSCPYMGDYSVPSFMVKSSSKAIAERVARGLGVSSVDEFRDRIIERGGELWRLFNDALYPDPLRNFNAGTIGTR